MPKKYQKLIIYIMIVTLVVGGIFSGAAMFIL